MGGSIHRRRQKFNQTEISIMIRGCRIPAMAPSELSRQLSQHMHQLEHVDLIRLLAGQPEVEYIFRHALVQESAYGTLVRADRRRTHRAVGETLEQVYAGAAPPAEA